MNIDLSILVSCYNEQYSIIPTLETLVAAINQTHIKAEILVIDDCSQDKSVEMIQQFIRNNSAFSIHLVVHKRNHGLIGAETIREALALTKGKYFWCVAGDNPVPVETCLLLFSYLGQADLIIPLVNYIGRTIFRRCLSWLYAFCVRFISRCPVRYYNGSSLFLREQFASQMKKVTGITYSAEAIVGLIQQGCSYLEIPVLYNERIHGKSSAINSNNFIQVAYLFNRLIKLRWQFQAKNKEIAKCKTKS